MTLSLAGSRLGNITVLEKLSERDSNKRTQWKCLCLCGNIFFTVTYRLTAKTKRMSSCGCCQWHIKHKDAYISWMSLKQRCQDPNQKDYPEYGGRGITFENRWHRFENFFIDMGDPPLDPVTGERLSIERKDNNGNYCKDNCKWATRSEQQLNKRTSNREIKQ